MAKFWGYKPILNFVFYYELYDINDSDSCVISHKNYKGRNLSFAGYVADEINTLPCYSTSLLFLTNSFSTFITLMSF